MAERERAPARQNCSIITRAPFSRADCAKLTAVFKACRPRPCTRSDPNSMVLSFATTRASAISSITVLGDTGLVDFEALNDVK